MLQNKTLIKNNFIKFKHFVLFITIFVLVSCQNKIYNTQTSYHRISVNALEYDTKIDSFITPYRNQINRDLDSVLAFVPVTLDKSKGKWQTNIGNWMADICLDKGNEIMAQKNMQKIDFCILNSGGIRSIISAGPVTARNAFEVMPFENKLTVAELNSETMQELIETFVTQKKPHPISGAEITFNAQNQLDQFKIGGEKINPNKTYFVITSDYLSKGGDNMLFFTKAIRLVPLDIKIRDVIIEDFKKKDTLKSQLDNRIILLKE